ncbi:curli production assembly/transport protein CsgE [Flavobacterium luminosum]|uniref:Curli production assembly/transport component CsgE n=1 Tax=Flavobacterium luminosum TaxID=2949086 RepID=A0ABT0TLJ9_9FLAO|nr:curli production assembly/transport protein CsgE [Flavobacterium sp. HXWNR70]MCL9808370.1 curli production assembly/transport protein CsgE [Flavobacterium sp. HXWNR70]
MKQSLLHIFFLLFSFNMVFSQFTNTKVKAKIEVEEGVDLIGITAVAENLTEATFQSLSYKFSIIRKGNNESNNQQGGIFSLLGDQRIRLSKTQINTDGNSELIVLLLIYDEDKVLIGKDRYVFGEKSQNSREEAQKKGDGVEITGIVSDETKTKFGKDFYDFFYTEFSKLKYNSSKVITVEEEIANARTTRIRVRIDSEILNEFISRPEEEFTKAMAEETVVRVFNYLKKIEKESKYITQY